MRISDWSSDVCSSDLLNFQPVASDGLALAASTKRARGRQLGLVRTTANLYGSTAWPVNAPSMRAQASGIWRSVWTTPLACGVAAGRVISGTGSAAKAGSAASSRSGRIGRMGASTGDRSEEHTSELQSLMRISYAVFCLKKKKKTTIHREASHI